MAHWISGVITSFQYEGPEANVVLVGPFHLVVPGQAKPPRFAAASIPPFTALTISTRRLVRDLSFRGGCAYVETRFHVEGTQYAAVWRDGAMVAGPYVSHHGTVADGADEAAEPVAGALNTALAALGVYRHDGKDEFDSLRLGDYRSNDDVVAEWRCGATGARQGNGSSP